MCGGTRDALKNQVPFKGLSPRVRGNQMHRAKSNGFIGSIPACAGEPALSGPHGCRPRVYPRVCGGTKCTAPNRTAL